MAFTSTVNDNGTPADLSDDITTFEGTNSKDTLGTESDPTNTAGADVVNAKGGDDFVNTGDGNDTINAGDGNDAVYGGAGDDIINGGAGNDYLVGGTGADTINGGAGNDQIFAVNDTKVTGELNNDTNANTIDGGAGYDTVLGGNGNDTITNAENVNSGKGDDTITVNGYLDPETSLSEEHETITVNAGDGHDSISDVGTYNEFSKGTNYTFDGGKGNDTITAGSNVNGNYTIIGGEGNDTMTAGAGTDNFVFNANHGNDSIAGFDVGQDKVTFDASVFASKEEALNAITYNEDGAIIDTGDGNQIFIEGMAPNSITADNIDIVNTPAQMFSPGTAAIAGVGSVAFAGLAIGLFSYMNLRKDFSKLAHKKAQLGYEDQLLAYSKKSGIPRDQMTMRDIKNATDPKQCLEKMDIVNDKQEFVKNARNVWTVAGAITGLALGSMVAMIAIPAIPAIAGLGLAGGIAISAAFGSAVAIIGGATTRMMGGRNASNFADTLISNELKSPHNRKGVDQVEASADLDKAELEANKILAKVEEQKPHQTKSFAEKFSSTKRGLSEIQEQYGKRAKMSFTEKAVDSKQMAEMQQQAV